MYRLIEMAVSTSLMLCFDIVLLLRSVYLPVSYVPPSDVVISLCTIWEGHVQQQFGNVCCRDRVCDDDCIRGIGHSHDDVRLYLRNDAGTKDDLRVRRRHIYITGHALVVGVSQTGTRCPSKVEHCLCNHPRWIVGVLLHCW